MDRQNKKSCYPMDANPIGHCLIINNVEFTGGNLAERVGSDQDATKLEELFGNFLNFTVELKRNVTKEQLESTLRHYQQKDHSEFCTFFVVILSHGDEGNIVYASDGQAMKLDDIFQYFSASSCLSLGGKPKVFIVQACRGNQHNRVVSLNRQDSVVYDGGPSTSSQTKFIKKEHSLAKRGPHKYFRIASPDGYIGLKFDAEQDEPFTGWTIKPHMKPVK
uniref:Caspase family p20 domain-containing protein n=1 Tax=Amphimedon queenslandica TaxID=400682 RepID=A0A1X7SLT2_AMPQE